MNQIAQQGKDMLEIVEKYEVPYEYHNALRAAYEAGAEMGFWKATEATFKVTDLKPSDQEAKMRPSKSPKSGDTT